MVSYIKVSDARYSLFTFLLYQKFILSKVLVIEVELRLGLI